MRRILVSIFMILGIVVSYSSFGVNAASVPKSDEKKEINSLINQLRSGEIAIEEGYNTFIIAYNKVNKISLTHSYDDGYKMTILNAQYDPMDLNQEAEVTYDFFSGMTGVSLDAKINITQNDYCTNSNCIPFEVNSSSYNMSQSDVNSYKKMAGTSFQLLISKLRYELATKYKIDLKYCGFRSISSLLRVGWFKKGGKTYYYANGKYVTGWKNISGKRYYFSAKGVMQKGFKKIGKKTYYFTPKTGAMKTKWVKIKGKKYYFTKKGVMVTGKKKIGKKTYRFNKKGVCLNP